MRHVNIIAEVAQAHDGDFSLAQAYVEAAAKAGVDVVKFQTHIAQAESSIHEPFRIKMAGSDKTRFDYWKRMEFTVDQWKLLKQQCDDFGVEFISSPFSCKAVDLLEELGVKRYKIGSGEVNNFLMLEKIARTGKPVILSSGMSSFSEIEAAIEFLKPYKNDISLMQCTTQYPTSPECVGLNVIQEMKQRYDMPLGLSDHSGEIYPCLAAIGLGAELLEVHVTFDKKAPLPDATSSLTLEQLTDLVKGVRFLEKTLAAPVNKETSEAFVDLKNIFEKSLAVNRDMRAGDVIAFEDLESKKPAGQGVDARDYQHVVGEVLLADKNKYDFLNQCDYQKE